MKNFEMNCPVEGTSALQPKLDSAPARRARIIAFPQHAVLPDRDVRAVRDGASIVSAVRTGSAQGVAFGRVQRWQAVVGGCVFAALALASLFASSSDPCGLPSSASPNAEQSHPCAS